MFQTDSCGSVSSKFEVKELKEGIYIALGVHKTNKWSTYLPKKKKQMVNLYSIICIFVGWYNSILAYDAYIAHCCNDMYHRLYKAT